MKDLEVFDIAKIFMAIVQRKGVVFEMKSVKN